MGGDAPPPPPEGLPHGGNPSRLSMSPFTPKGGNSQHSSSQNTIFYKKFSLICSFYPTHVEGEAFAVTRQVRAASVWGDSSGGSDLHSARYQSDCLRVLLRMSILTSCLGDYFPGSSVSGNLCSQAVTPETVIWESERVCGGSQRPGLCQTIATRFSFLPQIACLGSAKGTGARRLPRFWASPARSGLPRSPTDTIFSLRRQTHGQVWRKM